MSESTGMDEIEELSKKIAELGDSIKAAKSEKKAKDEWEPLLKEMLALKETYKESTGKEYGPPAPAEKKSSGSSTTAPSAKNAEKNALKAAKKAEKEAKKLANRLERERREREKQAALTSGESYGDAPLMKSQSSPTRNFVEISSLTAASAASGQEVWVRGHLQTVRGVGKGAFCLVRSTLYTVQCVCFEDETNQIPKEMVKYITALPLETVVDVAGIVTLPEAPVEAATQSAVELSVKRLYAVSKCSSALPFVMEDACRPDTGEETDVGAYTPEEHQQNGVGGMGGGVGQELRLNYRWVDLRTPANQSIFRIESQVGALFREFLLEHNFVEIHTPKIIGGASEGGSEVFKLDYFGRPACLAQSPQLYKQMACACSGFERVFETGPVFRAENSQTRRHLCEFTGLDLEMSIRQHYHECTVLIGALFVYIFDGLAKRCPDELARVNAQHPFTPLRYVYKPDQPLLCIPFSEGCAMLRAAGFEQDDLEDIGTEAEKKLGDLVADKYGVDFYMMDKYPLGARPFYTMPDPQNPQLSNSYDFFIRGQEILSGAQRIHDPALLEERAKAWDIPLKEIEAYVNSFRNGALPHAGGGIGLERVVMLYLGLPNIRKSAWFPRDPRRLAP